MGRDGFLEANAYFSTMNPGTSVTDKRRTSNKHTGTLGPVASRYVRSSRTGASLRSALSSGEIHFRFCNKGNG
jgi:hypothetical protein